MKFGVGLPTCREAVSYPPGFVTPEVFGAAAKAAEDLGYDSLWTNDHSTTPVRIRESFPDPPPLYEPTVVFAYVAALTSRIRFVQSALVVPARGTPVLMAREAAALDQLSNGRYVLGVCMGGYLEEWQENYPDGGRPNRGEMTGEAVELMRKLFTERRVSFKGKHYHVENLEMYPKPKQSPLPIYLTGNVDPVVERAGRLGEGWIYAGVPDPEVTRKVALLRQTAEAAGRDGSAIEVCPQYWVSIGETREKAEAIGTASGEYARFKRLDVPVLVVGTPDDVIERFRPLKALGVTEIGVILHGRTIDEMLECMDLFARKVIPALN